MINFLKKTLLGVITISLASFSFSGIILATADTPAGASTTEKQKEASAQQTEKNLSERLQTFQDLGRGLYAITWPLIIIAGKFMDNSVIYGSFIGMDVMLWKIWNVMRTFANYIIGLVLIFSIFTLFLGGKFEQYNPIKIIPQLVVSALLVNASWFILGACLDVSTILTYSVGMLPLNVSADELAIKSRKIPTFGIEFQNDKNPVKVGVKHGENIIPFCEITTLTGQNAEDVTYVPKNLKDGACVFEYNNDYYAIKDKFKIKKDKDGSKPDPAEKIKTKTFGQILAKYPGMSGVLGTLFASIINIGKLSFTDTGTTTGMMTDLLFKSLFLFALVIPLFAFALIMIARAIVLWMYIVISPIIFLFTSIKGFSKVLGEKGSLKEMCCMVFLPVTVTFALSISFVFLSTLKFVTLKTNFGISGNEKGNEIYLQTDGNPDHKITIKFKDAGQNSAMSNLFGTLQNTMLWVVKLMFAIGFMWILVFTALKSCKITSGIAVSIGNFATSMAKAAPILPGGQSVASLGLGMKKLQQLPGQKQSEQYEKLDALFKETTSSGKQKEMAKEIGETTNTEISSTPTTISSNLDKKVKIGNNEKKVGEFTFGSIDPNKPEQVKAVADALGVSEDFVKKQITSNASSKINSKKSEIEKEFRKEVIKKKLQDAISKNQTIKNIIDQDPTFQTNLYNVLNENFPSLSLSTADIDAKKEKLAKALKELGFSKDDTKKLIATNLVNNNLDPTEEKDLDDIIKKVFP